MKATISLKRWASFALVLFTSVTCWAQKSEEPKDGRIDLREWLNYATDQVPRMQEANMLEALRGRGRDIPFAEGEGDVKDPSRRTVQRPRIFYRRELESNPLVVAILGATPPQ